MHITSVAMKVESTVPWTPEQANLTGCGDKSCSSKLSVHADDSFANVVMQILSLRLKLTHHLLPHQPCLMSPLAFPE